MISLRVNEVFNYLHADEEELLKKCHQCMEIIVSAKDRQAAEANKNASILLEELDQEKSREESKKLAAARKREKKRRKKKEKQEKEKEQKEKEDKKDEAGNSKTGSPEPEGDDGDVDDHDDEEDDEDSSPPCAPEEPERPSLADRIQLPAVEQVSAASIVQQQQQQAVNNNNKASNASSSVQKSTTVTSTSSNNNSKKTKNEVNAAQSAESNNQRNRQKRTKKTERERDRHDREITRAASEPKVTVSVPMATAVHSTTPVIATVQHHQQQQSSLSATSLNTGTTTTSTTPGKKRKSDMANLGCGGIGDLDDFGTPPTTVRISPREKEKNKKNSGEKMSKVSSLDTFTVPGLSPGKASLSLKSAGVNSPTKRGQRKEEGWKEVIRKKDTAVSRSKKVSVPANAISRVIGRGGCNINAIREVSGAHIEVDKQKSTGGDRIIIIKGSAEVTRQAHNLITALVKDPDKELEQILPKMKLKMPTSTATVVTTNTATFTASMWHNSMANNIPAVTTTNVTSSQVVTTSAIASSKMAAVTKTIATTKAAIVTTAATLAAMMPSQNGFANAVRQQVQQLPNVAISRANSGSGVSNGTLQSVPGGLPSSPKRLVAPGANTSVSPSKAGAVCALFTDKSSSAQVNASMAKSTVTYTQASMAKTKVVTSTMPTTFAAKVDNRSTSGNPGTPKMQPKLQGMGVRSSKSSAQPGKSEPQPLPIKTTTPASMQGQGRQVRISSSSNMPGGLHMSSAPAEYSPFNNLFSQLQERVIGKKEDQMNFASVAAAGVVPQERQINSGSSAPVPPSDMHSDPNLIAKAPGYKAPGQRTTSPQVNELEPNKAPGYKGRFSPQQSQSDPLNEPLKSPNQFPGLNNIGHLGHMHQQPGAGSGGMNMDAFRVPPPPFIPGDYPDPSRIPGYRLSASQMSASSPRSASSTPASMGGQSPKPIDILSQLGARDEYHMPNQPMTLPRIESTLNPNAPDFTSRTDFNPRDFGGVSHAGFLHAQQLAMLQQQAGHSRDAGPPSQQGRSQPQHASLLPQQDMRVAPPSGPPPAAMNFNALLQSGTANLVLPPGSTNMPTVPDFGQGGGSSGPSNAGSFLNPAMMGATGTIPVATVGVVTPQQRQYQGGSPMQHQHSAQGSQHPTPSKADGSPTSSSAPSPTDHSKLSSSGGGSGGGAADDKRFPQPVGAGRTNKIPSSASSQNIFQLGDPAANAGLWAFAADLNADWISAVSSVMTTSVVTSTVMSGNLGSSGGAGSGAVELVDERPASHHAAISPHILPAFSADPTIIDPSLDQLQTAALLVPNNPEEGGAAVFANGGIPPATATAVLSIPPLYPQPPVGGDMWAPHPAGKLAPQQVQEAVGPGSNAEAKMMWNNWNAPPSM